MDINPNASFSSPFSPNNLLQMSLQSESNSSLSSSTSSIPYSPPQHLRSERDQLAASVAQSLTAYNLTPSTSGEMTPSSSGRSTPSLISAEALSAVRHQMVAALQRIKQLEEQIKAIPVLSVKVNVLKEEKRLLMMQLKSKQHGTKTRSVAIGDGLIEDYDASSEAEFPSAENGHGVENGNGTHTPPMSAVSALHFHKVGKVKPDIYAKKAIVAPVPRHSVATRSVGVDANMPISPKKGRETKSIGVNVNISPPFKSGSHETKGGDIPRPAMSLSVHRAVQLKSPKIDQRTPAAEEGIHASTAETLQSAFTPPRLSPRRSVSSSACYAQTELSGLDLDAIMNGARTAKGLFKEQSTSMESLAPNYAVIGTNTDLIQTRIMGTNTVPPAPKKPKISTAINTDAVEFAVKSSKVETRDCGTLPIIFAGVSKGVSTEAVPIAHAATETFVQNQSVSTSTKVVMTKDQITEVDFELDNARTVDKEDKETSIEFVSCNASTITDGVGMLDKGVSHSPDMEHKGMMATFKMASTECATMTDVVETPIEVEPAIVAVNVGLTEAAPPPLFGSGPMSQPEMVSVATSYEPIEMVSIGTDYIPTEMVSVGTDYTPTKIVSVGIGSSTAELVCTGTDAVQTEMVSIGTDYIPTEMVSVGTEYVGTKLVSIGTGHPTIEMVSVQTDYEHAGMVSVATDYTPTDMVSVGTNSTPTEMVSIGITCGTSTEMVSVATSSMPIEMVSVETTYTPQAMISVGTICDSAAEMVSEETMYYPPEDFTKTLGVGTCSILDNFCDRCDNHECVSQGVGECTIWDRLCDHCDNLITTSIGVGSDLEVKSVATSVTPDFWSNTCGVGTCSVDDLLCDRCSNLDTQSLGVGDCTVLDRLCDRCDNLTTSSQGVSAKPDTVSVLTTANTMEEYAKTIGVGSGSIHDVLCDKCEHLKTRSLGVGDGTITDNSALNKRTIGTNHSISTRTVGLSSEILTSCKAVGESDINDTTCSACEVKQSRTVATEMAAVPQTADTCVGNEPQQMVSEGSGDCTVLDRVCDRCENIITRSVAVGSKDISRYTYSCGVQVSRKCITRASNTRAPRMSETATMTDSVELPNSTSIGVGYGDVSKYTSGFGAQVGHLSMDLATETTPSNVQETSSRTDLMKETAATTAAIPKTDDSDNTLEPLLATMKELQIVKTESVTLSTADVTQSSPSTSPRRSRPRSLSSPRQKRPISPPKKVRPINDRPKSAEIVELEMRRRHTDDEPLRPPAGGAIGGSVSDGVDRWSSNSGGSSPTEDDIDSLRRISRERNREKRNDYDSKRDSESTRGRGEVRQT
ncbi:uncharacterized protein [Amphiura filiformis]|uniref:uncharacterized protein isoform X2 n=1 Tax=Amphiura filiformis TaxID=82378 RepID=UPI003B20CA78